MKSMGARGVGLVLLVLAGAAQAQREDIIGLLGDRKSVRVFQQAEGGEPTQELEGSALAPRLRVLETNRARTRVRVAHEGRDIWLDRRALQLDSDPKAACHTVASSSKLPTVGAGRGANDGCALAPTGK